MILADTSVWVDHFRSADPELVQFLNAGRVLGHPAVIGELALGGLRQRAEILPLLKSLPAAAVANHNEVLHLIEAERLFGRGIGYVDAGLLASVRLTPGAALWTKDKTLRSVAADLGMAAPIEGRGE